MKTHAIYSITNIANGRRYVGSAVDFHGRKRTHLWALRNGRHHSILLQRSWDKYGEAAFEFEVLEEVSSAETLLEREQHWIDSLGVTDPARGFNILKVAGSNLGKTRSPDSIAKQSASIARWTPEQRAADSERKRVARLGYKHSDETLAKMRGQKRTEETRARIGAAHKGRAKTPDQIMKIAASLRGRKLGPQSPETIAKRVAATRATKLAKQAVQ